VKEENARGGNISAVAQKVKAAAGGESVAHRRAAKTHAAEEESSQLTSGVENIDEENVTKMARRGRRRICGGSAAKNASWRPDGKGGEEA
jgi:hypothetical protein